MTFFLEHLPSDNAKRDERVLQDLVYFLSEAKDNEPHLLLEEIREGIKRIIGNGMLFTIIYNDTVIHSVEASPHPMPNPLPKNS